METWADKHGYLYQETCPIPDGWSGNGSGMNLVIGSVAGHWTEIFDVKTVAHGTGPIWAGRPGTELGSVMVLTVDGSWPAHAEVLEVADRPYQWRQEGHHLIAWWPGTTTPISMWVAANELALKLGLAKSRPDSAQVGFLSCSPAA